MNNGQKAVEALAKDIAILANGITGKTPEELIEYADKGLYKAKENGRNQVGLLE